MTRLIRRLSWIFFALVLSSLGFAQGTTHAFLWTAQSGMQDLGTLSGWPDSFAEGINESGAVVGYDADNSGDITAFVWTPKLGMQGLTGLQGSRSNATAINAGGQIVGVGPTDAFIWTRAGGPVDLGDLGGGGSAARSINKSGTVVGSSFIQGGKVQHAFIWTSSAGMQDLMSLVKGKSCPTCQSFAYGINDEGWVVGSLGAQGFDYQWPILYRNGQVRNLGDLGGGGRNKGGTAFAINNAGQVVGTAFAPDGSLHPFLWTQSKGMQDLGVLPNGDDCYAYGINESAQVVGYCIVSSTVARAFLWTSSTGIQDLGTLPGGGEAAAFGINDSGQVVGWSTTE